MANPAVSRSVAAQPKQLRDEIMGTVNVLAHCTNPGCDICLRAARLIEKALDDLLAFVAQEAPQEIRRAFEAGFTARYDEIEEEWFFASYIHPAVRVEKDGIDAAWTAYQAYLAAPPQEGK